MPKDKAAMTLTERTFATGHRDESTKQLGDTRVPRFDVTRALVPTSAVLAASPTVVNKNTVSTTVYRDEVYRSSWYCSIPERRREIDFPCLRSLLPYVSLLFLFY